MLLEREGLSGAGWMERRALLSFFGTFFGLVRLVRLWFTLVVAFFKYFVFMQKFCTRP